MVSEMCAAKVQRSKGRAFSDWPYLAGLTILGAVPLAGAGSVSALTISIALAAPLIISALSGYTGFLMLWATCAIWSVGQAYSNFVHEQYYVTFLVYVGPTIALTASGLFYLVAIKRIATDLVAIAFGTGWLLLKLSTGVLSTSNPWKYGLCVPIAIIAVAAGYRMRLPRYAIAAIFATLAIVSRIYDNRFQTALFILAAIVVILLGSRLQGRSGILLLLAGLTAAMYLFYPAVAISGALGERAQAQQIRDNANDASFLLSIRKELPMTAYLAGSNLPTGIGSYSAIDIEQSGRALTFVESFTGPTERSEVVYLTGGLEASTLGYKAHSQAFSAILFAGLLAIPFWLWAGCKLLGGIANVCARRSPVPGLTFYMITLALWDTLFSPMNANTHLTLGFALFLVLLALNSRKSSSVPLVAKAARKSNRGTPESLDNASALMDCHVPTMYRG